MPQMVAPTPSHLPPGWVETTVANVGRVRVGRQRSPQRHTGPFPTPYLRAANITPAGIDLSDIQQMDFTPEERSVYALVVGDVVLTEASGSPSQVGRSTIWREELPLCCFQNTVIRLRPHSVISEYALLVFRHYMSAGVFAEVARGIGIQHLGGSRLAQLPFPLPPLAEQRRIVDEATRRADDLRAAAASLQSALASTHALDSEVLAAAVAGRVEAARVEDDSGASNRLPAGWRLVRVDEAGEVTLGKQRSSTTSNSGHMRPYLRVANVFEDQIDLSDVKEMTFTPKESETYALESGDILLNEGQSPELVGRPAMYRGELPGACFQNALLRFRASPEVDPDFALIVFRHYLRSGEFKRNARWSTNIAHLSRTRFAAMPFPLPPVDEQRAIAGEARRILDETYQRREAIALSLERITVVEAEILAAAVSGALVPQQEGDEHAEDLLRRCGKPPPDRIDIDNAAVEETDLANNPELEPDEPRLAAVLRQVGPLTIPELCKRAAFDLNDTGEIERFYLMLREELDVSVEAVGDNEENQTLRAITDAP